MYIFKFKHEKHVVRGGKKKNHKFNLFLEEDIKFVSSVRLKKKKNEHIFGWEGQKNTQAESKQKCHANNKAINLRLLSSLLILTILILYQYQQIISRNSLRLHF